MLQTISECRIANQKQYIILGINSNRKLEKYLVLCYLKAIKLSVSINTSSLKVSGTYQTELKQACWDQLAMWGSELHTLSVPNLDA